jgi:hypothetical protein
LKEPRSKALAANQSAALVDVTDAQLDRSPTLKYPDVRQQTISDNPARPIGVGFRCDLGTEDS